MIKEDVINKISQNTGYSRYCTTQVIDALFSEITKALANGHKVRFSGFGTFEPKEKAARTGRNPRKNEAVHIPARIMPVFTAGKNLKSAVIREIKE